MRQCNSSVLFKDGGSFKPPDSCRVPFVPGKPQASFSAVETARKMNGGNTRVPIGARAVPSNRENANPDPYLTK